MYLALTSLLQLHLSTFLITQLFVAVFSILASGCSGLSAPNTVRPDLAKDTLIEALTAWKDGSTIDALQTQSPAIVVQDTDWSAGKN